MSKNGILVQRECPSCGEAITLGRASLDKKIRCPKCRSAIIIPMETAAQIPPGREEQSIAAPGAIVALNAEEVDTLAGIIASIEREPHRTYFVVLKELGTANGIYQIRPGDRLSLEFLKSLLPSGSKEAEARTAAKAWPPGAEPNGPRAVGF